MSLTEEDFEAEIVDWLVTHGGYIEGRSSNFDRVRALDPVELMMFIKATQSSAWRELVKFRGGDDSKAEEQFLTRVANEVQSRGTVDVVRHGVVDHSVQFVLAYFRPAYGLTSELLGKYQANRVTVTRQLRYDDTSANELDLGLFVNGLLVATAELKNGATGQSVEDAKEQYRADRSPTGTALTARAVVHFAVDTEQVALTTELAGRATRFLPFNKGYNSRAGNPPSPTGVRTDYLWRELWSKDRWLDVIQRFVRVDVAKRGVRSRRTVTFPRYHQWDAVKLLVARAREEGAGHSYLVQHSAGSGKSNTIAWLAHHLSSLHDDADHLIFDKVVVVTDRKVLDQQLQDTIFDLDHAFGVVQKIDENSKQLAAALAGAQARILITTLQKFPVVLESGIELPDRRYAVVVDEAHSSQTGESAAKLKAVLGVPVESDGESDDQPVDTLAAALTASAKKRGPQANLSFFAFTATPKGRTLAQFGEYDAGTERYLATHLYSMMQAIDEGFILDVLQNYVTYQTFWNIEKRVREDPTYDSARAKAAIAKFVSLHETNLDQKAQVIVEHFRQHVRRKVDGHAKAMVVTSSRLHAVKYQRALTKYIGNEGYDLGVLVAFSGTVLSEDIDYSEPKMNGFSESETPARFDGDEWQVLVVAEKYQTGFDQPLLYAMYVDKTLTGLAAVQTLSRLNRIHPAKDGTFVLDFRNNSDDIRSSFAPWYGSTATPPTDPNVLYDARLDLRSFDVLRDEEVAQVAALLLGLDAKNLHGRVHAAVAPAIDRFWVLIADEQEGFREALDRYVRFYAFLSQVVSFYDPKLEGDYLFCRAIKSFIRSTNDSSLDLGAALELTYIKTEQASEGSISLNDDSGEVSTISSGTGTMATPDEERLSEIIARLNERFGTDWAPEDRVFYDVVARKLTEQQDIQRAAAVNSEENFGVILRKAFTAALVEQMSKSEDMALKLLDDEEMQDEVLAAYLPFIQTSARVAWQEHCPIGELLGPDRESAHLEYKSTLRTRAVGGEVYKPLEGAALKTIAAFQNSADGGTLLIGVSDDGSVHGVGTDYQSLMKSGKGNRDLFELHLNNVLVAGLGGAAATNVAAVAHTVDEKDLWRVHVRPSAFPVEATVTVDVKGQFERKTSFFVRIGNATRSLEADEREKYVLGRWTG